MRAKINIEVTKQFTVETEEILEKRKVRLEKKTIFLFMLIISLLAANLWLAYFGIIEEKCE